MANLSILSGIEFYSYDVEVYDKVLLGTIRYKESQVTKFKKIDKTFFENKSFYGINRGELVKEFIKYLSKYDSKIDKDSFLLGDVVDKRIKKGAPYVNDTMIFMASTKQYDAQAVAKDNTPKVEPPKEVLKLPMEYKDKIYKVRLNLEELGIGTGQKTLYDFNEAMLKSKVESFLKSYKKEYNIQLSLQEEFVQVGKLLIDVTVYNDHVEGFIDLSSLNLDGISSIKAEGKDKQELLNNIIQQLKAHKLTGKLNWGTVTDKTKKGANKVANIVDTKTLKALMKNLSTMVKKVGFDESELEGRIESIIPNVSPLGVGNLGGNKIDIAYVLPWQFDKTKIKKKKFAEEYAETAQSNIVIKETPIMLYLIDYSDNEITIEISTEVHWINTFFGSTESTTYPILEEVIKIESKGVDGILFPIKHYIERITKRSDVVLLGDVDITDKFPTSFKVKDDKFKVFRVGFIDNDSEISFKAEIQLNMLMDKLLPVLTDYVAYLKNNNFGATREGANIVVRGNYDKSDPSMIDDLVKLINTVKGYSPNISSTDAEEAEVLKRFIKNIIGRKSVKTYASIKASDTKLPNFRVLTDGFKSCTVEFEYQANAIDCTVRVTPFPGGQKEAMKTLGEYSPVEEANDVCVYESFKKGDISLVNTLLGIIVKLESIGLAKVNKEGNLLLSEFIEKISSRPNVKLVTKIDKYTPYPVSFDVEEKGFAEITVRFDNNASQYRASFRLDGPFSELQSKTYSFYHYLDTIGFDVTQEGLGVVVKGAYDKGDISIINDLATLLDKIKAFSYNHANSFEAWAKKHKYGYTEAKVFFQVRDIIPNYDGHAIVYKSGKSNYIAIPNDVEGIDGFISAVKHAYTPDKAGAYYRFYFPNLEEMQKFVEFANKIDKPVKEEPSFANSYVKKGEAKAPKLKDISVFQAYKDKIMTMTGFSPNVMIDKDVVLPVSFQLQLKGFQQFDVSFYENSTQFRVIMMPEGKIWELEPVVKKLMNSFNILGFDAQPYGMAVSISESFDEGDVKIISRLVNIIEIAKTFAKTNANILQPDKQDLGGVKPNNEPIKPSKEKAVIGKSYLVKKGDVAVNIVPFEKGQFYDVIKVTKGLVGEDDLVDNYRIQVLSILKSGKIKCKNITLGYEFKINNEPANVDKTYTLVDGNSDAPKVKDVSKVEQPKIEEEPVKAPKEEIEPPNREVERTFKASKVKDPEHKEQLNRMKAYVKKIADVVDADNDFALRFLEEPKEFQKYKLPTVGLGLFYYGDKSATELEQNALYKKVYRGRGLSILRKFFKTTDLNGEKCLLVLFVDAQYAKETKAKLIKESFELGNKVRINGRLYKVNAIYEHKFAIETIAGLMYIDMDSDLIDITIEED